MFTPQSRHLIPNPTSACRDLAIGCSPAQQPNWTSTFPNEITATDPFALDLFPKNRNCRNCVAEGFLKQPWVFGNHGLVTLVAYGLRVWIWRSDPATAIAETLEPKTANP